MIEIRLRGTNLGIINRLAAVMIAAAEWFDLVVSRDAGPRLGRKGEYLRYIQFKEAKDVGDQTGG